MIWLAERRSTTNTRCTKKRVVSKYIASVGCGSLIFLSVSLCLLACIVVAKQQFEIPAEEAEWVGLSLEEAVEKQRLLEHKVTRL